MEGGHAQQLVFAATHLGGGENKGVDDEDVWSEDPVKAGGTGLEGRFFRCPANTAPERVGTKEGEV